MTPREIRTAIEESLNTIEFTSLDWQYCVRVRDELRKRLDANAKIDVFHRFRELVVDVRAGKVEETFTLSLV